MGPYSGKIPFRTGQLIINNKPIHRKAWESPGADGQPGIFQQSMIALHGLTRIVDTEQKIIIEPVAVPAKVAELIPEPVVIRTKEVLTNGLVAITDGEVRLGNTLVAKYVEGAEFEGNGKEENGWVGVKTIDGKTGYVLKKNVKSK